MRTPLPLPGLPLPLSGLRRALIGAVLFGVAANTGSAYTATLTPASSLMVYLQVGVGSFTNNYINGGQPGNNTTINTVSFSTASPANSPVPWP